jgi:flagellar hook protein FlgE
MALIGSLSSGVSALQAFSKDLEIIGNNISNVNTSAFKSSSLGFSESFSNTLRASQPGGTNTSNVLAAQIGTGVRFSGVNVNFAQGALATTGQTTDLGISGNGFFVVKDAASGVTYATRAGSFRWDDKGFLVTATGLRVQDTLGADITQPPVPAASPAGTTLQSVSIDTAGDVIGFFSDGTSNAGSTPQQIGLTNFAQPGALMNAGDGLFTGFLAAGQVTPTTAGATYDAPGIAGLGTVQSGTLEQSNVDLTSEFANMITAQRSFQASSRVVTVSDSVLEEIVNLKR